MEEKRLCKNKYCRFYRGNNHISGSICYYIGILMGLESYSFFGGQTTQEGEGATLF